MTRVIEHRASILAAALFLGVSGCSTQTHEDWEEAAYELVEDDLSRAAFQDVGDTSDCTQDCSGHEAGFEWAKERGLTAASECSGSSDSFIEGCETYAHAIDEGVEAALEDEEY